MHNGWPRRESVFAAIAANGHHQHWFLYSSSAYGLRVASRPSAYANPNPNPNPILYPQPNPNHRPTHPPNPMLSPS